MKAAVYRKFGGPEVVKIEEVATPTPKKNEVLVRNHAATVSAADHRLRAKDVPKGLGYVVPLFLGVFAPRHKILGMDMAGTVEAIGVDVTRFKVGDEVVGMTGRKLSGHAEYVTMGADAAIALKPKNMSFEEAVTLPFGGLTALDYLQRLPVRAGHKVLVNGASGAVGTAAVQLAKHFGAHVTGVCSGGNRDLVLSLGADEVIDYTIEDFTKNGKTYDAIVECVGNAPFSRVENSIKSGGALLFVIADLKSMLSAKRYSKRSGKLVTAADWKQTREAMEYLVKLAESGEFRAVIDETYPFEEIVLAHRYVDTGHKVGNVVVTI